MMIQTPSRSGSQGVYSSVHQGGQEGPWMNGRALNQGDTAGVSMKSDNIEGIMLLTKEELEKAEEEGKQDPSTLIIM